jgi:hypothetical protein
LVVAKWLTLLESKVLEKPKEGYGRAPELQTSEVWCGLAETIRYKTRILEDAGVRMRLCCMGRLDPYIWERDVIENSITCQMTWNEGFASIHGQHWTARCKAVAAAAILQ